MLVLGVVLASALVRSYPDNERGLLWMSYAAHVISALSMVVIVRGAYGGGDMFAYFRVGSFFSERLRADFLDMAPRLLEILFQRSEPLPMPGIAAGSNTGSMQALSGFICLLAQDSLYAAGVLIGSASFAAKLALFNAMKAALPDIPGTRVAVACMLVPSAVFWSSGLLKEPIAVVGLSAMVFGGHLVVNRDRWFLGLIWVLGGGTLAGLFKGYLLPPFGIGAGFFYVSRAIFASGRVIRPRYLVVAALLALFSIVVTGTAMPHFAPEAFEDEALSAQAVGQRISGGSNYTFGEGSLVSQLPIAFLTVLYRPFIFEVSNVLMLVNALETLAAAVLTIVGLSRTSFSATLRYVLVRPALCFCLGFVLTLAVGVGLTTTNLGTLSRYRVPLVPFYALLLLSIWGRRANERARIAAPVARVA
jgi:hypothetical protein